MSFGALTVLDQIGVVTKRVNDPRGSIPTGLPSLDHLLYRGGLQPGLLCILGGRTHTRKTTVTANLIARLLKGGRAVGFIGLDETAPQYTLKIMSAMYGVKHETIEENWESADLQEKYLADAAKFSLSTGYRPSFDDMTVWMDECELQSARPEVVFIDYISLLGRGKYDGADTQRMMRLIENLQVWTNEQEVITIALHQLNRAGGDDGQHPMKLTDLKHGGEEIADIVLGTYRPALDPIGNVTFDEAQAEEENLTEEKWERHRDRVERYKHSTLLQVLKNRPGTKLDRQGIELVSVGETMQMRTASEGTECLTEARTGQESRI